LLHVVVPALVTRLYFERRFDAAWLRAWGTMMLTMLVDLDHLAADPIYDPMRCSMGFHPLHTFFPVIFYLVLLIPRQTRLIGAGLSIHMLLDTSDCMMMPGGLTALESFVPWEIFILTLT
jgi:hypothetical protein